MSAPKEFVQFEFEEYLEVEKDFTDEDIPETTPNNNMFQEDRFKHCEENMELAKDYLSGTYGVKDIEKARLCYEYAAEFGSPEVRKKANCYLAIFCMGDYGHKKNISKAIQYFNKAIELGYDREEILIYLMDRSNTYMENAKRFLHGIEVEKDIEGARRCYEFAALFGNGEVRKKAHYYLGIFCTGVYGHPQDIPQALQYFIKAVELGHPEACQALYNCVKSLGEQDKALKEVSHVMQTAMINFTVHSNPQISATAKSILNIPATPMQLPEETTQQPESVRFTIVKEPKKLQKELSINETSSHSYGLRDRSSSQKKWIQKQGMKSESSDDQSDPPYSPETEANGTVVFSLQAKQQTKQGRKRNASTEEFEESAQPKKICRRDKNSSKSKKP